MLIEEFNEVEKLDGAIETVLIRLEESEPDSDEHAKMVDQLTKLIKIKEIIAELKLKSLEALNKKETEDTSASHKTAELNFKIREHDTNVELKRRELENKERELVWKTEESQDAYSLKKRELDLKQQEADKPDRVSKDTLAIIAGNIAGIVMIIGYERVNVIASKALSFVMKSR